MRTPPPSGSTDAYRAAELRVTAAAASVTTVGAIGSSRNVIAALVPGGLPIELGCDATAVYFPHARAVPSRAEAHSPPFTSPSVEATTGPSALAPSWIATCTGVSSLAVPEKIGAAAGEGDGSWFRVTVGDDVSTEKVTALLRPAGFPIALCCVATAVKVPSPRVGVARLEVQPFPVPCAVALATASPLGSVPEKTSMLTGVASLAVPENDGVGSLEGDASSCSVTVGGCVSTTNVAGSLSSTTPPMLWLAIAVNVCVPPGSDGAAGADDQLPPVPGASAIATSSPSGAVPW
ncbi:MAG TPA: hypothetical protein VGX69_12905 [Solirubrobacteraceae bacterium]|nr:hypothetical protein [Solirubrobacteraceae bacterium]